MKKIYKKSYACVESFEMSEFIAGNCEIDVGFGDTGSANPCSMSDPDIPEDRLFNDYTTCTMLWDDPENTDKGCVHIPQNGHGYFGS